MPGPLELSFGLETCIWDLSPSFQLYYRKSRKANIMLKCSLSRRDNRQEWTVLKCWCACSCAKVETIMTKWGAVITRSSDFSTGAKIGVVMWSLLISEPVEHMAHFRACNSVFESWLWHYLVCDSSVLLKWSMIQFSKWKMELKIMLSQRLWRPCHGCHPGSTAQLQCCLPRRILWGLNEWNSCKVLCSKHLSNISYH